MMDIHYAACEKYTSSQKQNRSNPRAVNERALDKMEIKDKVNSMAPAEWSRFENRWELWKSDQYQGRTIQSTCWTSSRMLGKRYPVD